MHPNSQIFTDTSWYAGTQFQGLKFALEAIKWNLQQMYSIACSCKFMLHICFHYNYKTYTVYLSLVDFSGKCDRHHYAGSFVSHTWNRKLWNMTQSSKAVKYENF